MFNFLNIKNGISNLVTVVGEMSGIEKFRNPIRVHYE